MNPTHIQLQSPKIKKKQSLSTDSLKLPRIHLTQRRYPYRKNFQSVASLTTPHPSTLLSHPSSIYNFQNFGILKGFGYKSIRGLHRPTNQDKIAVIPRLPQPLRYLGLKWPRCSYFGLFDGHGGPACAEFLRRNLHKYIITDEAFPYKPRQALLRGFAKAQFQYRNYAITKKDFSGSCALVVLLVQNRAYIANLGDSRAVLSYRKGEKYLDLTLDHKPDLEKERIREAGGELVRMAGEKGSRIVPGLLGISRSFGDIQAKLQYFGGLPGVLIAEPEVWSFEVNQLADFILMGSDGIFDVMDNETVVEEVWKSKNPVQEILEVAMRLESLDNLSCIIIGLS